MKLIQRLEIIDSDNFSDVSYRIDYNTYQSPRLTIIEYDDEFFSISPSQIDVFIEELKALKNRMESYEEIP
jgi:hypothetical protein